MLRNEMNLLRGASAASSAQVATLFDIRIQSHDRDCVVLRGAPGEGEGVILKGVLVLSLHDPIQARNITLSLRGKAKAGWTETITTASRTQTTRSQRDESIVYENTWSFLSFSSHSKTIGVGNYEYPFEVRLPSDLPESVEGVDDAAIGYMMVATVERPGLAQNITSRKRIRVVRTLSIESLEMAQTLSVDNTWPNKIEYAISIPTKSYPIGSTIPINFKLVPLLKGLSIQKITAQLKEYQSLLIENNGKTIAKKEVERNVCSTTIEDLEKEVTNWDVDESLQIPGSLAACVQDCEVKYLRVRHKMKFTVALLNPDGHVSELRAALPVSLLIPPSIFGSSSASYSQLELNDPENQLPSYETHVYDRLYDGIETPLLSGVNTPAARSRRGSIDGHAAAVGGNGTLDSEQQRRALMAGLSRLTSSTPPTHISHGNTPHSHSGTSTPHLPVSGLSRSHEDDGSSGSSLRRGSAAVVGSSHQNNTVAAAAAAAAAGAHDHSACAYSREDMDALSRIPSYDTAIHNTTAAPLSTSLPDYDSPLNRSAAPSGRNTPVPRLASAASLGAEAAAQTVTGFDAPGSAANGYGHGYGHGHGHGLGPPSSGLSSLARPAPARHANHIHHHPSSTASASAAAAAAAQQSHEQGHQQRHGIFRQAHDRLHINRARDH